MTRRQLADEQWTLIEPHLPIGDYVRLGLHHSQLRIHQPYPVGVLASEPGRLRRMLLQLFCTW